MVNNTTENSAAILEYVTREVGKERFRDYLEGDLRDFLREKEVFTLAYDLADEIINVVQSKCFLGTLLDTKSDPAIVVLLNEKLRFAVEWHVNEAFDADVSESAVETALRVEEIVGFVSAYCAREISRLAEEVRQLTDVVDKNTIAKYCTEIYCMEAYGFSIEYGNRNARALWVLRNANVCIANNRDALEKQLEKAEELVKALAKEVLLLPEVWEEVQHWARVKVREQTELLLERATDKALKHFSTEDRDVDYLVEEVLMGNLQNEIKDSVCSSCWRLSSLGQTVDRGVSKSRKKESSVFAGTIKEFAQDIIPDNERAVEMATESILDEFFCAPFVHTALLRILYDRLMSNHILPAINKVLKSKIKGGSK